MKTRTWIFLLALLLAVCAALSLPLFSQQAAERAEIWSDGVLLATWDLAVDQEMTVKSPYGENVVTVSHGKIAVTQATCPDHYCMARGFCAGGAEIVCLPNRLVIRFLGESDVDVAIG
ncbi:MAG TPA: NusG domain II-containing protein [Candidatus Faecousia intestinigallinarum]|nr:NusG domain II-containing protein [Candidatus Faecousia intestinigallinarum]